MNSKEKDQEGKNVWQQCASESWRNTGREGGREGGKSVSGNTWERA